MNGLAACRQPIHAFGNVTPKRRGVRVDYDSDPALYRNGVRVADSDPALYESDGMLAGLQCRRLLLGANGELRGEEAMLLRHRRLGAIEHVVDELRTVRRLDALAVD